MYCGFSNFENLYELSDLILDLLNDKTTLIQMGKKELKRVKAKYSWNKVAKSHLKLYKKVLNLN